MTHSTAARSDDAWKGRVEDDALLRGRGRFGDDVKPDDTLAAYFVRSPHAFAKIVRIDVSAAKGAPGVVAVLTAADFNDAHYHSISHGHPIPGRGGKTAISPHRPSLAETRVMHVGEPVAMVVAKTAAAAQDPAISASIGRLRPTRKAKSRLRLSAPSRKRLMWCASSSSTSGWS
jgi:carbon-monoxide dehydrogenase large subunit